jgi:DNA-binding winged helix-turn-helix (wHTH) protein
LRNGELVLQLSQQPLQILYLLLEHPGELVAREEVRTKLWPDGTFLDFEDGINHAVRRLRDALGDSAETPRFIQTVPRRGYRFIYSIDRVEALPEPGVSQVPAGLNSQVQPENPGSFFSRQQQSFWWFSLG